ncbi:MAG: linoleoyl-CoA desaturase [Gemmatimonadetes bacterium]|nr:MAG: linoleoyl-CoA desaturase [Gemmatimonadota bacterium]
MGGRPNSDLRVYIRPMLSVPIKFGLRSEFRKELHARVDAYLGSCGRRVRAPFAMYRKSLVIIAWMAVSYIGLVFYSTNWWQFALFAISLSLAAAGMSFNIPHDASHGSYSTNPKFNRAMAFAFDIMGASSYLWHWKHNVFHHGFTNIPGVDDDINLAGIGRMAPTQKHYKFHRFQHYYLWVLYGLITVKWQLVDDYINIVKAKIGTADIPRPKGGELALFVLGKLCWLTLFLVLPLTQYSLGLVIFGYLAVNIMLGTTVAVVFQMAHTVEEADFVPPPPGAPEERIKNEWAAHQVETTVNFAPRSALWTWYLGGLNYQIEHHLFPSVSHVHYPALAPIVEETCKEHGVSYSQHPTFRSAIASHFRWLKQMSRPPQAMTA